MRLRKCEGALQGAACSRQQPLWAMRREKGSGSVIAKPVCIHAELMTHRGAAERGWADDAGGAAAVGTTRSWPVSEVSVFCVSGNQFGSTGGRRRLASLTSSGGAVKGSGSSSVPRCPLTTSTIPSRNDVAVAGISNS